MAGHRNPLCGISRRGAARVCQSKPVPRLRLGGPDNSATAFFPTLSVCQTRRDRRPSYRPPPGDADAQGTAVEVDPVADIGRDESGGATSPQAKVGTPHPVFCSADSTAGNVFVFHDINLSSAISNCDRGALFSRLSRYSPMGRPLAFAVNQDAVAGETRTLTTTRFVGGLPRLRFVGLFKCFCMA